MGNNGDRKLMKYTHTTDDEIQFIENLGTFTERGRTMKANHMARWLNYRIRLLRSYIDVAPLKDWNGLDRESCVQYAEDKIQEVIDYGR